MKKKQSSKLGNRLVLGRESIRNLSVADLVRVAGGYVEPKSDNCSEQRGKCNMTHNTCTCPW